MRLSAPLRAALVPLWGFAVLLGFYLLWVYAGSPGEAGAAAETWPADVPPDSTRPTLLLFAHPHCPCTRASIEQLARLSAKHEGALAVHVVFWAPADAPAGWTETDLWRSAAAVPGVTVRSDIGGREARRYGAKTSGHVVLYDLEGRLLFHGGITGARGHNGDNPGADAVSAHLTGQPGPVSTAPVFGCPLFDVSDEEAE